MSGSTDYTPLEHAAYAVAMQLGTLLLFGRLHFYAALAAGTALGIGFFIGREHAQAEKRWNPAWGARTNLSGFDLRKWDKGSILDLAYPAAACVVTALVALLVFWRV